MDINELGWGIVRKRVRSVVSAEKSHRSIGLSIVLEGKGVKCGFSEQESRFSITLAEILITITKPLPRAWFCVDYGTH